jgi:hypothetical protein
MAGGVLVAVAPTEHTESGAQSWPSRGAAYYGLAVIILATMLNLLDGQVFGCRRGSAHAPGACDGRRAGPDDLRAIAACE